MYSLKNMAWQWALIKMTKTLNGITLDFEWNGDEVERNGTVVA
jgi:hypothetical protein